MDNEKKKWRKSGGGMIFRYADWVDFVLMFLGAFGAIGDGMSTNCLLLFASRIMNSLGFGQNQGGSSNGVAKFMDEVEKVSIISIFLISSPHFFFFFFISCFAFCRIARTR